MYVRYRWGRLTIQLGEPGNWLLERTILGGEMIYSEQLGDDLHGWMSYEELVQHTSGVISWPAAETAWESTDWAWREIRGRGMAW